MTFSIKDITNIDLISDIIESINEITGVPNSVVIIDRNGNFFPNNSLSDYCELFHKNFLDEKKRCIYFESLKFEFSNIKKSYEINCVNGITTIVTPVVVDGRHVANILIGQFLKTGRNSNFIKKFKLSDEVKDELIKFYSQIRHIPEEKVAQLTKMSLLLARIIQTMAINTQIIQSSDVKIAEEKREYEDELARKNKALEEKIIRLEHTQEILEKSEIMLENKMKQIREKDEIIRYIVEGSHKSFGVEYFQTAVSSIAEMLNVSCCGIVELKEKDIAESIVLLQNGNYQDNISFNIINTHAHLLVEQQMKIYLQNAQKLFVHDQMIKNMEIVGFYGYPFFNHQGRIIGYLFLANNGPLIINESQEKIIELFSIRCGDELEHIQIVADLSEATRIAQEANTVKSAFLANMSHEIRTPLNAVLGFTQLLTEQIEDPVHKSFIEIIEKSSKSLLSLINDILDLSKIEAGKLAINFQPTNPANLALEMKSLFQINFDEKGLKYILEYDEDIPKSLILDETRLRQVLFNLIANSLKFTNQGYVKIIFKMISQSIAGSPINIRIIVEDTGKGIDPENVHKVFDAFYQETKADSDKTRGTGLGLTITKKLVEMSGGKIHVESEIGKGSRFIVDMENIDVATFYTTEEDPLDPLLKTLKFDTDQALLMVDDEQNSRNIRQVLSAVGISAITANSTENCEKLLQSYDVGLIIIDYNIKICENLLKTDKPMACKKTPLLILSSSGTIFCKDAISNYSLIQKPITRDNFIRALAGVLAYQASDPAKKLVSNIEESLAKKSYSEISEKLKLKIIDEFGEEINQTRNSMILSDISKLAADLEHFSNINNCPSLNNIASELSKSVAHLEIENISVGLNRLQELIQSEHE